MANTFIDHTKNIDAILAELDAKEKPELLEKQEVRFGNLYVIPKDSIIESVKTRRKTKADIVFTPNSHDENWVHFSVNGRHLKTHRTCIKPYIQEYILFFFDKKRYRVSAELYYQSEHGKKYSFIANKNSFTPVDSDPVFEIDGKFYCPKKWDGETEIQLKSYYEVEPDECVVYKAERFPLTDKEKEQKKKQVARKYKDALKSFKDRLLTELRWKHKDFFDHDPTEEEMTNHTEALMSVMAEAIEEYEKEPKTIYATGTGKGGNQISIPIS